MFIYSAVNTEVEISFRIADYTVYCITIVIIPGGIHYCFPGAKMSALDLCPTNAECIHYTEE